MLTGYSSEVHPAYFGYRLARSLRGLRNVRGWSRLASYLAPPNRTGEFIVNNDGIKFSGNVQSYLDRQVYLFGGYEGSNIEHFLSMIPLHRRRVILDIGANIGTHALSFAKYFEHVHAFEPNPTVCQLFKGNLAINDLANISLHEVGLGNNPGTLPFFLIDKANFGLGTFLNLEQYDLPLRQVSTLPIENGDVFVENAGISNIDAIKIDVQGFEPEVLAGLSESLRRYRPFVWFEYAAGTRSYGDVLSLVRKLIPYPSKLWRLSARQSGLLNTTVCEPVDLQNASVDGDYVIVPDEE